MGIREAVLPKYVRWVASFDHQKSVSMNEPVELTPRSVSDSQSEMIQMVLPNDTNPLGTLLGGTLMHWIDLAGALAGHRHARQYLVTASIDHLSFRVPVPIGDVVILRASVNRAFTTSMEVGVKVWAENYITGERKHVSSAYLTFVAVDRGGKRLPVPPVIPQSEDEQRRYQEAGRRRDRRSREAARKSAARG